MAEAKTTDQNTIKKRMLYNSAISDNSRTKNEWCNNAYKKIAESGNNAQVFEQSRTSMNDSHEKNVSIEQEEESIQKTTNELRPTELSERCKLSEPTVRKEHQSHAKKCENVAKADVKAHRIRKHKQRNTQECMNHIYTGTKPERENAENMPNELHPSNTFIKRKNIHYCDESAFPNIEMNFGFWMPYQTLELKTTTDDGMIIEEVMRQMLPEENFHINSNTATSTPSNEVSLHKTNEGRVLKIQARSNCSCQCDITMSSRYELSVDERKNEKASKIQAQSNSHQECDITKSSPDEKLSSTKMLEVVTLKPCMITDIETIEKELKMMSAGANSHNESDTGRSSPDNAVSMDKRKKGRTLKTQVKGNCQSECDITKSNPDKVSMDKRNKDIRSKIVPEGNSQGLCDNILSYSNELSVEERKNEKTSKIKAESNSNHECDITKSSPDEKLSSTKMLEVVTLKPCMITDIETIEKELKMMSAGANSHNESDTGRSSPDNAVSMDKRKKGRTLKTQVKGNCQSECDITKSNPDKVSMDKRNKDIRSKIVPEGNSQGLCDNILSYSNELSVEERKNEKTSKIKAESNSNHECDITKSSPDRKLSPTKRTFVTLEPYMITDIETIEKELRMMSAGFNCYNESDTERSSHDKEESMYKREKARTLKIQMKGNCQSECDITKSNPDNVSIDKRNKDIRSKIVPERNSQGMCDNIMSYSYELSVEERKNEKTSKIKAESNSNHECDITKSSPDRKLSPTKRIEIITLEPYMIADIETIEKELKMISAGANSRNESDTGRSSPDNAVSIDKKKNGRTLKTHLKGNGQSECDITKSNTDIVSIDKRNKDRRSKILAEGNSQSMCDNTLSFPYELSVEGRKNEKTSKIKAESNFNHECDITKSSPDGKLSPTKRIQIQPYMITDVETIEKKLRMMSAGANSHNESDTERLSPNNEESMDKRKACRSLKTQVKSNCQSECDITTSNPDKMSIDKRNNGRRSKIVGEGNSQNKCDTILSSLYELSVHENKNIKCSKIQADGKSHHECDITVSSPDEEFSPGRTEEGRALEPKVTTDDERIEKVTRMMSFGANSHSKFDIASSSPGNEVSMDKRKEGRTSKTESKNNSRSEYNSSKSNCDTFSINKRNEGSSYMECDIAVPSPHELSIDERKNGRNLKILARSNSLHACDTAKSSPDKESGQKREERRILVPENLQCKDQTYEDSLSSLDSYQNGKGRENYCLHEQSTPNCGSQTEKTEDTSTKKKKKNRRKRFYYEVPPRFLKLGIRSNNYSATFGLDEHTGQNISCENSHYCQPNAIEVDYSVECEQIQKHVQIRSSSPQAIDVNSIATELSRMAIRGDKHRTEKGQNVFYHADQRRVPHNNQRMIIEQHEDNSDEGQHRFYPVYEDRNLMELRSGNFIHSQNSFYSECHVGNSTEQHQENYDNGHNRCYPVYDYRNFTDQYEGNFVQEQNRFCAIYEDRNISEHHKGNSVQEQSSFYPACEDRKTTEEQQGNFPLGLNAFYPAYESRNLTNSVNESQTLRNCHCCHDHNLLPKSSLYLNDTVIQNAEVNSSCCPSLQQNKTYSEYNKLPPSNNKLMPHLFPPPLNYIPVPAQPKYNNAEDGMPYMGDPAYPVHFPVSQNFPQMMISMPPNPKPNEVYVLPNVTMHFESTPLEHNTINN